MVRRFARGQGNVGGGALGAVNALNSLRTIGRALHAWVIPQQASISQAWQHFDDDGNLKDNDLAARVKEVGQQVARFAFLHTSDKAQEFLATWEGSPINPGGSDLQKK